MELEFCIFQFCINMNKRNKLMEKDWCFQTSFSVPMSKFCPSSRPSSFKSFYSSVCPFFFLPHVLCSAPFHDFPSFILLSYVLFSFIYPSFLVPDLPVSLSFHVLQFTFF
ncbi:hypothetical protein ILYODFUR_012374 [Ilyodon furcidens]|uniref:Uncharacterized protein n=1 Tax=Ilyodon furcidens TaxID=33524 RepID=A0ABV0T8P9_9TELE